MTRYRSRGIKLVEQEVDVCETQEDSSGEYDLRYDSWSEATSPSEVDVFLIVWFDFLGSNSQRAFFVRDVFRHHIELSEEGSRQGCANVLDHEVDAAGKILVPARKKVADQLRKAGLAEHILVFQRMFDESIDLKASFARWRREEQEEFLWKEAERIYSRFPIRTGCRPDWTLPS